MTDPISPFGLYVLRDEIGNGHVPVPIVESPWEWGDEFWALKQKRTVGATYVGMLAVSTVFTGIDPYPRRPGEGPNVFETMIFDRETMVAVANDRRVWRTSTWESAEVSHRETVDALCLETGCEAEPCE